MFESNKNKITFPHIIPGNKLGDKAFTFNDVNGGATRIAAMGIERNDFYGGAVISLGYVKELGFYICPHFQSGVILGFYIHDPATVTDYGKELIAKRFPGVKVEYVFYTTDRLTQEQIAERKAEKLRFMEMGVGPEIANHASAEQLKIMVKVMEANAKSPELKKKFIEDTGESTQSAPYEPDPEVYNMGIVEKGSGIDQDKMAANMMKESRKK